VGGRERAAYKYYARERRGVEQPPKVRPVLAEMRMCPREFKDTSILHSWQIGWRIYLVGDPLQTFLERHIWSAYCRLEIDCDIR
jgi:hypothetical protein